MISFSLVTIMGEVVLDLGFHAWFLLGIAQLMHFKCFCLQKKKVGLK